MCMTLNKLFFSLFKGQPEDPSWRFLRAETTWSPSGKAENKGSMQFISFFFRLPLCRLPPPLLSPPVLAVTVWQCAAACCAV